MKFRSRTCKWRIIKIHSKDFNSKGYTHHVTKENLQDAIKSEKTDYIAAHNGSALKKIKRSCNFLFLYNILYTTKPEVIAGAAGFTLAPAASLVAYTIIITA